MSIRRYFGSRQFVLGFDGYGMDMILLKPFWFKSFMHK